MGRIFAVLALVLALFVHWPIDRQGSWAAMIELEINREGCGVYIENWHYSKPNFGNVTWIAYLHSWRLNGEG